MRFLVITAFALTSLGLLWSAPSVFAAEKQAKARRAMVRVLAPAGAKLTINGKPAKKPTDRRFVTPPLENGKTYTYTLKAEFVRGHNSISVAQKVKLRAGQKKLVSLRLQGRSTRYGSLRRPRISYSYRMTPSSASPGSRPYDTANFLVWPYGD